MCISKLKKKIFISIFLKIAFAINLVIYTNFFINFGTGVFLFSLKWYTLDIHKNIILFEKSFLIN